jgi:dTDP-glucose pyrophosphorylase
MIDSVGLTIVIPAAGEGSRFVKAGYTTPKPFIRIHGTPMIDLVIANVSWPKARYVLILRTNHLQSERAAVNEIASRVDLTVQSLDALTQGTACTVLTARDLISPGSPLLIANSDQLVRGGVQLMLEDAFERGLDGSIMTFRCPEGDTKWSYARCNAAGMVVEVAEKRPISEFATVGIYYFGRAQYFFDAAEAMITANDRVNSEFYTCPTYNYSIAQGKRIGVFEIDQSDMIGLGTPEEFTTFVRRGGSILLATRSHLKPV